MPVPRVPPLMALVAAAVASPLLLIGNLAPATVGAGGVVLSAILVGGSITGAMVAIRRRDRSELERSRALLAGGFDGVIIERDGCVVDVNAAMCLMLDLAPGDVVGRRLGDLIACGYRSASGWRASGPGCIRSEVDMVGAAGVVIPVEILSRPLVRIDGPARMLSVRDISSRRAANQRFGALVTQDPLTDLPNRCWLEGSLHTMLENAAMAKTSLAIVFVSVGEQGGSVGRGDVPDSLLPHIGQRLRANVRAGDLVARTDQDEFVVVQMAADEPDAATTLVARLREVMGQPYVLDDATLTVAISLGLAVFPRDGTTAEALLRNCDIVLSRGATRERRRPKLLQRGRDADAVSDRVQEQATAELYHQPRLIHWNGSPGR